MGKDKILFLRDMPDKMAEDLEEYIEKNLDNTVYLISSIFDELGIDPNLGMYTMLDMLTSIVANLESYHDYDKGEVLEMVIHGFRETVKLKMEAKGVKK